MKREVAGPVEFLISGEGVRWSLRRGGGGWCIRYRRRAFLGYILWKRGVRYVNLGFHDGDVEKRKVTRTRSRMAGVWNRVWMTSVLIRNPEWRLPMSGR